MLMRSSFSASRRKHSPHRGCCGPLFGGDDVRHRPTDAAEDVDRWEVPAGGEFARQPNVPIEQPAHGVGDRLVLIIPFHEDRIVRRDAAGATAARPLDEPRQQGKHTRRIAARRRGFAGGKADLALPPSPSA